MALYQFEPTFNLDQSDLTTTSTGSGVHLNKTVTINLDILDRTSGAVSNNAELLANGYVQYVDVDILNTGGDVTYSNYLSGYKSNVFTFTEYDNINVFGQYTGNFGIRAKVIDRDSSEHTSEFYFYGNVPQISGITIQDSTGTTSHNDYTGDKIAVNTTGQTGALTVNVTFDNDTNYINFNRLEVYRTDGSGAFSTQVNPQIVYTQPLTNQINYAFDIEEGALPNGSGVYLHFVPHGSLGTGQTWTAGPYTFKENEFANIPYLTEITTGEISGALGFLPTTGENVVTSGNLDTVSGNLDTTSGNLDTVSGNLDTTSGNLDTVSGNLDTTSGNLDTISGNLDTVSGNLDTTSGNLDTVSGYVDTVSGDLTITNSNLVYVSGLISDDQSLQEILNSGNSATGTINVDIFSGASGIFDNALTVSGNNVATESWVTSQGYITSETDDQTLQEVLDAGNSATGTINVDIFSGESGVFHDTLRVGDAGFVDFPSNYDTLQVGTSSQSTNGHILIRGQESSLTFRGAEGADKAYTIKEDAGSLSFYGDSTLSGTAGNRRFTVQTAQSYFTDLVGVQANGAKPQFYLASTAGGAQNKATHFYHPTNSADFRIAVNGGQDGTIGDDVFTIESSTRNVGIGTDSPDKKLTVVSSGVADGLRLETTSGNTYAVLSNGNSETTPVGSLNMWWGSNNTFRAGASNNEGFIRGGSSSAGKLSLQCFTQTVATVRDGGFGIFYTDPSYELDVSGSGHFLNDLIVDGNVGIGTGAPGEALEVVGNVEADEFIGDLRGAVSFKAQAGENLTKGDVVYISGISGNTTIVSKADADDASKMPAFGIVKEDANSGNPVTVVNFGSIGNLDTSAYSEGDELYISTTAGLLTGVAPTGEGAFLQKMAKVTRSDNAAGSITVMGAGRTNAVPNLNEGHLFVGNSSNQSVADDTISVDIANDRVNIGTTNQTQKLNVDGSIFIKNSSYLKSKDGGATIYNLIGVNSSGYVLTGQPNRKHIITGGSSQGLHFSHNSSTTQAVLKAGDFGIGTDSPTAKLDVRYDSTKDGIFVKDESGGAVILLGADGSDNARARFYNGSHSQNIEINSNAGSPTYFNAGNVGIGTTSPSAKLEVVGDIRLRNANGSNPNDAGSLIFAETGGTWGTDLYGFRINQEGSSNYLNFQSANNTTVKSILTLTRDTARVGIGTTSPSTTLDVRGNIISYSNYPSIYVSHSGTTLGGVRADATTKLELKTLTTAPLSFQVNASEKMRITNDGYVGIGDTTPSYELDVAGDVQIQVGELRMTNGQSIRFGGAQAFSADTNSVTIGSHGSYIDTYISSDVTISGDAFITGTLDVTGDITMAGNTVLTGITSGDITGALGYTPVDVDDTGSFLTDYTVTEADVTGALGYTPVDVDDTGSFLTDYTVTEADVTGHQAALTLTSGQITGALGFSPISSETDDQTLDEVLAQGNTSSRDMQVETITGFQLEATGEVGLYLTGPYPKIRSASSLTLQTDDANSSRATFGSNYLYLKNNGTNDVFRMEGGNAIIGSNTTPTAKLDVRGNAFISGSGVFEGAVSITETGATEVFSVDGSNGRLFGVTDEVTGTVFSVNDAAGLPIVEVESTSGYDKITIGEYGSDALVISGTNSAIFNVDVDITGGLDVTGDITMGGNTVLTGVTSDDITGALGYTPSDDSDFDSHTGNSSNPHSVTAAQVGAYTSGTVDSLLTDYLTTGSAASTYATDSDFDSHTGNSSNPHSVTAAQVGAYTSGTVDSLLTDYLTTGSAASTYATDSDFDSHTGNSSNPHSVTAAQVGAYTSGTVDSLLTDYLTTGSAAATYLTGYTVTEDDVIAHEAALTLTSGQITGALGFSPISSETDDQTLHEVLSTGNVSSLGIDVGDITGDSLYIGATTSNAFTLNNTANNTVNIVSTNDYLGFNAGSYIYAADTFLAYGGVWLNNNTAIRSREGDNSYVDLMKIDSSNLLHLGVAGGISSGGAVAIYSSGIEAVRIDEEGNVGIGTDNPDSRLEVGDGSSDDFVKVYFNDGTNLDIHGYGIEFNRPSSYLRPTTNSNKDLYIGSNTRNWNRIAMYSADDFLFYNATTELIRITSEGNIGIGYTAPSYELDVSGSGHFLNDLIVDGDITMGGNTVLTGVTSDDITGALGYTPSDDSDFDSHTGNSSNPHSVTAAQVGAYTSGTVDSLLTDYLTTGSAASTYATDSDFDSHTGNSSNPHSVTAAQVGAYTSGAVDSLLTDYLTTGSAASTYATDSDFDSHTGNSSNPHSVTAAQVGAYTSGAVDSLLTDYLTTGSAAATYLTGYTVTEDDVTGHQAALTLTSGQITGALGFSPLASESQTLEQVTQNGKTTNQGIDITANNLNIRSGNLYFNANNDGYTPYGVFRTGSSNGYGFDYNGSYLQLQLKNDTTKVKLDTTQITFETNSTVGMTVSDTNVDIDNNRGLNVYEGGIYASGDVGIGVAAPSYKLHVSGTASFTDTVAGAYFEENASHPSLKKLDTGTILVMNEEGQLVPCFKADDKMVFGVSKSGYKQPIVMGAEPIRVTGPIEVGDFITTSDVPGHGKKSNQPYPFGTIIAQAMESGDGESYNIKAMIRKM